MLRFPPFRFAAAVLLLAGILLTGGSGRGADEPESSKSDQPKESAGEGSKEGFVNLLPGGSLELWQGRYANPSVEMRMLRLRRHRLQRLADMDMAVHWKLCDGVLTYDGRGKNMRTVRQYGNFEMYVDWKISKNGVGAIYLRSCPAVKIWDPALESLGAEVGSGGLFYNGSGKSEPLVVADNPVGEWNEFYIKMVGQRVTVKLNGQLVVDDEVLENQWNPDAPVPAEGHIEFEGSRSPMQFRNAFLRELP